MQLNKKQVDKMLHIAFTLSYGEGRTWHDRKFTDAEIASTEERIKSFVINEIKKDIKKTKGQEK